MNDFMVVDAGGGTVDITVHRQISNNNFIELHSPSGGAWGSSFINTEFEKWLVGILGASCINKVKDTCLWYSVMDTFEVSSFTNHKCSLILKLVPGSKDQLLI